MRYDELFPTWAHVLIIAYTMLCSVFGLIANMFIIHATRLYSSFNLDKVTIRLVRQLAIVDLSKILIFNVPILYFRLIKLDSDAFKNVEVSWPCKIIAAGLDMLLCVGLCFYLAISVHRAIRCWRPTLAQRIRKTQTRIICGCIWLLFGIGHPIGWEIATTGHEFNPSAGTCTYNSENNKSYTIFVFSCYLLFIAIIIGTNISTLAFAKMKFSKPSRSSSANEALDPDKPKTKCSLKRIAEFSWEPHVTIFSMCICVIISFCWLPYAFAITLTGESYLYYGTIMVNLSLLTEIANPIVYTVVNKRFKAFFIKEYHRIFHRKCEKQLASTEHTELRSVQ